MSAIDGHALLETLQSLDRVNRIVQRAESPMAMLRDVLDAVLEILDCDRAWLLRPCDPDAAEWFVPIERTRPAYPGVFASGGGVAMDAEVSGVFRALRSTPTPLHFGPGAIPLPSTEQVQRFQVRAMIMSAIYPRDDTPYAFGLHRCARAQIWSAPEVQLFEEIARRIEDALGTLLLLRRLRDSETKLGTAQRIAQLGYWERDFETASVTLSTETCRILGFPLEQTLPVELWLESWHAILHPDDREATEKEFRRALSKGTRYDIECRIDRAGEERILHAQGDTERDDTRRVHIMFGVVQDITERRRAEAALRERDARFRAIVDHATDGFFLFDDSIRIVDVNRGVCESLGYTRDELIGAQPTLFDPNATPQLLAQIGKALASEGALTFESVHRRKDGSQFPVEVRIRRFDEGSRRYGVALARDITERVHAEEQLRRSEEHLRQSQKMDAIGQLAGGVAHDFNNILAVMMMQTEFALAEDDLDSVREALIEIRNATERASSLTRQLLVFGRRQVIQRRELDLNEVVASVAKMLRRIIGEDIELDLALHGTPLIVNADAGMLDQVLMNLAVNARDAMPRGGTVRIETGVDPTPGPLRAYLSLSDEGGGIPATVLPHIFEPFFTTKEPGKGTGLGLATVFGIVHQHDGTIDVRSEPGSTSFRVTLPALPVRRTQPTGERERPRGGTETILYVEDDDILRASVRRSLEHYGYRVVVAASGAEALALWRTGDHTIDLLFTDLVMPGGVDGHELARTLRAESPQLKVIFISGYSPEIAGTELALGAGETFLQKPIAAHAMLRAVRDALDRP
jgi:two-component system cell cycle sensor histidine kinase/response regulator CckA